MLFRLQKLVNNIDELKQRVRDKVKKINNNPQILNSYFQYK
jgi:hypothetical protein